MTDDQLLEVIKPVIQQPERLLGIQPISCPRPNCGCTPKQGCGIKSLPKYREVLASLGVEIP